MNKTQPLQEITMWADSLLSLVYNLVLENSAYENSGREGEFHSMKISRKVGAFTCELC